MSEAHLWEDEGLGGDGGVGEESIEPDLEEDETLFDELEDDADTQDELEEEQ